MRQLLPWAEQTQHRDMTAMLMVCCSSVGFFHGFSQSGEREAACVKNEAVNVKSLQYTHFCPDLLSAEGVGILLPLDELLESQTPQTWSGTAVTQGCCTPWLVSTSSGSQRTCGKGGRAPAPVRAPPCHSTPKPSAETTRDTHLAVQHRRKSVDAGVTLWGSITHRGGWDLMWGKRETPEVT